MTIAKTNVTTNVPSIASPASVTTGTTTTNGVPSTYQSSLISVAGSYDTLVSIRVVNGSSTTAGPMVSIMVQNDGASLSLFGQQQASNTASADTEMTFLLPMSVQSFQIWAGNVAGAAVTLGAQVGIVTSL